MAKTDPLPVRLDPDMRAALERAAVADDRTLSAMVRKALGDWLRDNGYLAAKERAKKARAT